MKASRIALARARTEAPGHRPVPGRAEHYRGVRDRFEELYAALVR